MNGYISIVLSSDTGVPQFTILQLDETCSDPGARFVTMQLDESLSLTFPGRDNAVLFFLSRFIGALQETHTELKEALIKDGRYVSLPIPGIRVEIVD